MERHPRSILDQPSVRELYLQASKELGCSWGIGGQQRLSEEISTLRGKMTLVLTTILLSMQLLRCLIHLWSQRLRRLSVYSGMTLAGIVVSSFLLFAFAHRPAPVQPLDMAGLLLADAGTVPTLSLAYEEDSTLPEYEIPPELYPDTAILSQEPLYIAYNSLPLHSWGEESKETDSITTRKAPALIAKTTAPPLEGAHHIVKTGENLWDIANAYQVSPNKLAWYNPDLNPRKMMPGDKVFIPGAKDPQPRIASSSQMILPFVGAKVKSSYGNRSHPIGGDIRFHRGVDISAKYGTPIHAVLDGKVVFAGRSGKKGIVVELEHEDGLKTVYAHNRKIFVKRGQRVQQGTVISEVGSSGYTTGPHLHFEVWKNGIHKNPEAFLFPNGRQKSRNRTLLVKK